MMNIKPVKTLHYDRLPVHIYHSDEALGQAAALHARASLQQTLLVRNEANIILATGNSQLTFLRALRQLDINWSRVRVFHMDEYVGIDPDHRASFPRFLREHFLNYITPGAFFPIDGQIDPAQMCAGYTELLKSYPPDLVALGWGENGHLAFNDPPYAQFDDPARVKVVQLADASRRQQVGEGHFSSLTEVPTHAITLTIPALLAARHILCIVPEGRKAVAVEECLTKPVDESRPGSVLRTVNHARLFLDVESAARLHEA